MATFDRPRIIGAACEATGHDDFGPDSWREGFDRLLDSLESEAQLNELGMAVAEGEFIGYLTNRLGIVAHRKQHPEIADADVTPPIIIVGQGRTGTTILFDLLAQDPAHRVPLTWEVDRPCPPPETATYLTDPRIDEVEATTSGIDLVLPGFRAMHPLGARLAQECVRITALDFRSMIFPTQYRVPSYTRWLLHEADMAPAYRWHRMFLQHLQSRHHASRWVLKSPGHIWCLDAALAEYPDALLVQTHRDPMRILASLASLVAKLRSLASDTSTIPQAAGEWTDLIIDGLDRSVVARRDGTVPADRIIDTQFRDFMADPIATVASVYEHLGLPFAADVEAAMRRFLAEHPQGEHGAHEYTWAATQLDAAAVRARTRPYQDFFGVPDEPLA
jgi:hypothetical protein